MRSILAAFAAIVLLPSLALADWEAPSGQVSRDEMIALVENDSLSAEVIALWGHGSFVVLQVQWDASNASKVLIMPRREGNTRIYAILAEEITQGDGACGATQSVFTCP